MPIKPENKNLYPENWPEIRANVLKRDHGKCRGCGLRNHSVGNRDEDGHFLGTGGNIYHDLAGDGLSYPSLEPLSYSEARELAGFLNENDDDGYHYIVIVLTVAHLDHDPTNNEMSNLASLCQRCHNRYDRNHRSETIRRNKLKGQLQLKLT